MTARPFQLILSLALLALPLAAARAADPVPVTTQGKIAYVEVRGDGAIVFELEDAKELCREGQPRGYLRPNSMSGTTAGSARERLYSLLVAAKLHERTVRVQTLTDKPNEACELVRLTVF